MFCSEKRLPRASPVFVEDLAFGIGVHDFSWLGSVIKTTSTSNPPVETNRAAAVGLLLKWNTTLSKHRAGERVFTVTLGEGSFFCTGCPKRFPSALLLNTPVRHIQRGVSSGFCYTGECRKIRVLELFRCWRRDSAHIALDASKIWFWSHLAYFTFIFFKIKWITIWSYPFLPN